MDQKQKKNKILKFLPRAASAVNFQNRQPFSPSWEPHRRSTDGFTHNNHKLRGFSGPFVSIIPEEVRRKHKPETEEPTSPKVSCMGQIKRKEKMMKKKAAAASIPNKSTRQEKTRTVPSDKQKAVTNKGPSGFWRLFRGSNSHIGSYNSISSDKMQLPVVSNEVPVPCLEQMKRFASGRESLKNFDWTAHIPPVKSDVPGKGYYSDEDQGVDSEPEEENETVIPFSAPITPPPSP